MLTLNVFQEDISKLRRKIEKAKKPAEKISNGDEILNEEINEYKVGFWERGLSLIFYWTTDCFLCDCTFTFVKHLCFLFGCAVE